MYDTQDDDLIVPAFADVHVHFREPGYEYKETIQTGAASAINGGYLDVCTMPNLNPVPDNLEHLSKQLEKIREVHGLRIHPFGAITCGEKGKAIADLEAMAHFVCGFSDDGCGVCDDGLMKEAMYRSKALNKVISAHCEYKSLIPQGAAIHDGTYARLHNLPGIPSLSEWKMVERDLELVRDTKCHYHICHVSTKESIELIRAAKKDGLPVSCETAPHYLILCDDDVQPNGHFKMNPPLRSKEDKEALLSALYSGTIDCIATDHAPHSDEEKAKGFMGPFGVVGLECAFSVLYTKLIEPKIIPLEIILRALTTRPREIFSLPPPTKNIRIRRNISTKLNPLNFASKGHYTPFSGMELHAKIIVEQ